MYIGIIYCATSPSNKKYYGKTTRTLNARINEHRRSTKSKLVWHFINAIRSYGVENFEWEVVEQYERKNLKELNKLLNEREVIWIKESKSHLREYGYNMTNGGEGTPGRKRVFTEEHKQKIRDALIGKKLSKEHKDKISNSLINKPKSEEAKKNISEGRKGMTFSTEHKQNIVNSKSGENNPNWKKPRSEETKEKIKQGNIIAWKTRKNKKLNEA